MSEPTELEIFLGAPRKTDRAEYRVPDDGFGERTLIVPAGELPYSGDPIPVVREIEAVTRTRLKDGGNPMRFIRLHERDYKSVRPGDCPSFAEYVRRSGCEDWIDVISEWQGTGKSSRDAPDETGTPSQNNASQRNRAQWIAEAMIEVRDNPDKSDAAIAKKVGKDKSTLSRCPEYQQAALLARQRTPKKGIASTDGEGGVRFDGVADGVDPADLDWDD